MFLTRRLDFIELETDGFYETTEHRRRGLLVLQRTINGKTKLALKKVLKSFDLHLKQCFKTGF